jgi:hypothetical protein
MFVLANKIWENFCENENFREKGNFWQNENFHETKFRENLLIFAFHENEKTVFVSTLNRLFRLNSNT